MLIEHSRMQLPSILAGLADPEVNLSEDPSLKMMLPKYWLSGYHQQ